MNVGDMVRINKCDLCPMIVGKTAKVTGFTTNTDNNSVGVTLNFGRGRPQTNRPKVVNVGDVSLVEVE